MNRQNPLYNAIESTVIHEKKFQTERSKITRIQEGKQLELKQARFKPFRLIAPTNRPWAFSVLP